MFDTVPSWICRQRGETYFEEHEVDAIRRSVKALDR